MHRLAPLYGCFLLAMTVTNVTAQSAVQPALEEMDATVASYLQMFAQPEQADDPEWLARAFAQMSLADQHLRRQFDRIPQFPSSQRESLRLGIGERVSAVDKANRERLRRLMPEGTWFQISLVGREVARNAWLIVQHADQDVAFQKDVLARMKALPSHEVEPVLVAYLHDRVAMHDERPQRFGTQGRCVDSGGWVPHILEDPDEVDTRRASVGLGPLAEYIAGFAAVCP